MAIAFDSHGADTRRTEPWTIDGVCRPLEWAAFGMYITLLYKLRGLGILLLFALALSLIGLRNTKWRVAAPEAGLAIAYAAMATVTAFAVRFGAGVNRSTLFILIACATIAISKYVGQLNDAEKRRMFKHFTWLNLAVLVHCIIFHLYKHYYTTWKYLADTKFIFSALVVIVFMWEDTIKRRSIWLWVLTLVGFFTVIVLSGERKAYLLCAVIYLLSRARYTTIAIIAAVAVTSATLYIASDPTSYVARQLSSATADRNLAELPQRYFFTVPAITNHSDIDREFINRNADRLFRRHRLFGVGATGYQAWARATYGSLTQSGGLSLNVHGERHRVPSENGILGIVVALLFVGTMVFRVTRYWWRQGLSDATSMQRGPAFLLAMMISYAYSEALDTMMLMLVLIVGFFVASLDLRRDFGALRTGLTRLSSRGLEGALRHRDLQPQRDGSALAIRSRAVGLLRRSS